MSTVLVTGGRDFMDGEQVFSVLDSTHAGEPITLLVHGACCYPNGSLRGADGFAQRWAVMREVPVLSVPAKWKQFNRRAGPERNRRMLSMCAALGVPVKWVVAFAGGDGTADMRSAAEERGITVSPISPRQTTIAPTTTTEK